MFCYRIVAVCCLYSFVNWNIIEIRNILAANPVFDGNRAVIQTSCRFLFSVTRFIWTRNFPTPSEISTFRFFLNRGDVFLLPTNFLNLPSRWMRAYYNFLSRLRISVVAVNLLPARRRYAFSSSASLSLFWPQSGLIPFVHLNFFVFVLLISRPT
jgi:hypothetical protein